MDRLTAWANTRNGRSQVALERVGFKREGVLRAFHRHGDVLHDVVVFGMTRNGWMRSGLARGTGRHRGDVAAGIQPSDDANHPADSGVERHDRSRLGSLPAPGPRNPRARIAACTDDLGEVSMPDHARRRGTTVYRAPRSARHSRCCSPARHRGRPGAAAAAAAAAGADACRRRPRSRCRSTVPAAQPCPGARRRSGARARRVAVGCLVNKARTQRRPARLRAGTARSPAPPRRHARDMARRGYFAHQRAGGPSLARRARAAGFRGRRRRRGDRLRLRLARARPLAIVRAWLASPPHRAILLSRPQPRRDRRRRPRRPSRCGGRGATYVLDAGLRRSVPPARPRRTRGPRARARPRSTAPARAARRRGRPRPRRAPSRPTARRRGA